jgi:KipI family sensor histidine kinase inhibitor
MSSAFPLTATPLAESALLFRVGDGAAIDEAVVDAVVALTRALDAAGLPGVTEIVPSYSTLLVEFDPMLADGVEIESSVRAIAASVSTSAALEPRTVIIPVLYGEEMGPDLDEMAAEINLSPEELVRQHAGGSYRVACMGFSPGWAYLLGLPPALTVPRLKIPRTRVPSGSVAVGGAQTGVYPLETPGGWRLIGRTPLKMFDPERNEPFLLQQGDKVVFAPIDRERFAALERGDG